MKRYLTFAHCEKILIVLFALGTFAVTGCRESLPETINVHGIITFQGKPLSNGMVTFEPIDNGENPPLRPAKGYTDNQGAYQLSTFRTNDGAMPGNYKVLVHAFGESMAMEALSPNQAPPKPVIPHKYSRSDTSDLAATITSNGPSDLEFNFELIP